MYVGLGAIAGITYLTVAMLRGGRRYFRVWTSYTPSFPSPPMAPLQEHS